MKTVSSRSGSHELTIGDLRNYWYIDESDSKYIRIKDMKMHNAAISGFERITVPGIIDGKQVVIDCNSRHSIFPRNVQEVRFKEVSGTKVKGLNSLNHLFWLDELISLDLSGLDTSQVTNMSQMFNEYNMPILILATDPKLVSYDFDNDGRKYHQLTYNAGKGTFTGGKKEIKKDVPFVIDNKDAVDGVIAGLEAEVEIPTRPGYTFGGWQKQLGTVPESLKEAVNKNPNIKYIADIYAKVTATYTAKWIKDSTNTYPLTIDYNDTITPNKVIDLEAGTRITKPEEPTNGDKVFVGWYKNDTDEKVDFNT